MKKTHRSILIVLFSILAINTQVIAQSNDCFPALFADLKPGVADSSPNNFTELNGSLYFSTLEGLWETDGTAEGTVLVYPTIFNQIKHISVLNNELIISTNKPLTTSTVQLWKFDGVNVTILKDFPNADSAFGIESLTPTSEFVFFTLSENNIRKKLWRTDGTETGTIMVKDIDPTNSIHYEPNPFSLTAFNNNLYFTAGTTVSGNELWKSNGFPEGTIMVKDINAGLGQGVPGQRFAILNDELYFYANAGTAGATGMGLWKTDGTESGTAFVKKCWIGGDLTNINDVLYFQAAEIDNYGNPILYGFEVWISDGSSSGTRMLKDINPGVAGSMSNTYSFTPFNSNVLFIAADGVHGLELWTTDGTEEGTKILKEINTVDYSSGVNLYYSKIFNGFLYFSADDGSTGSELWRTDGTEAGTNLVADLNPGPSDSYPNYFTIFNGNLFFSAETDENGIELWSCQSGLSVSDYESAKSILFYPNPVKDILHFSEKLSEIKIYDMSGKLIKNHSISIDKLNVNDLPKGNYIITATTQSGNKFNQKFIKN